MSTNSPRVQTVLDRALYADVKRFARARGVSLSEAARGLIREAVDLHEDSALDGLVGRRRNSWSPNTALTTAEVRARFRDR